MNLSGCRISARAALKLVVIAVIAGLGVLPATAQNKKHSWEVFIYFGGYFNNDVPAATQSGEVSTYRLEPELFQVAQRDPTSLAELFSPDVGHVGGNQSSSPTTYPFENSFFQILNPPCSANLSPITDSSDPRARYSDECDYDQEARWLYNANGETTNGEIQRDDSEFTLGIRGGYNITRHWEVEFDLGFGKQRLDLTQNIDPLLRAQVSDVSDPRAQDLAKFYQFTWADVDFLSVLGYGQGEHPMVIASRKANDPNYSIPVYFPMSVFDPNAPHAPERYDDVTGFINRVFQDPTAFRNRGNQINIDQFTISGSVNYNFNTKADSRIVPYVSAGFGRWIRNFDEPWDGDDTNFLTYGGGVRFFVNEIFAFRAELRNVHYLDDNFTITAKLNGFDLKDRQFEGSANPVCERDQRLVTPPCEPHNVPSNVVFPDLGGGGGNASVDVVADLDDFYEVRIGFDVVLGGK